MITQLRDVRPAGQSAEVAVKHQQQPAPTVVRENMNSTTTVPKFERNGRFPCQLVHRVTSRKGGHLIPGPILLWTRQNANALRLSPASASGKRKIKRVDQFLGNERGDLAVKRWL